ncbi:MAG: 1-acyl-sn-glycerol-3-phosphate acyltransferase [Flavobacteriales bacterium]|nr:1-acyl-sn-glycerol-3-phosphate acyltransferase [Flavobacteriales bacterium]
MGYILAFFRLLAFLLISFSAAVLIFFTRLFRMGNSAAFFFFRMAIASIRKTLNIRVNYSGDVPNQRVIIMANHRSYIDIVLIPSRIPYVIVAKKQVKSWPVVGFAAQAIKVIFVDRDSPASRRKTRNEIVSRINQGLSVLIYPEGTTFEGPGILPLKPGIFKTASAEAIPVLPVLMYR